MNKIKNTVSSSQKKAQKKYDQKTKVVSIKYTPYDMDDYKQLKDYLTRTNQSVNGFVKQLIKNFFAEGNDKKQPQIVNPIVTKREQLFDIYPFVYIDEENIQILYDLLGEKLAPRFLDDYYELVQLPIENFLESKGYDFDEWIIDIKEQVINGEIDYHTKEELYKIMFNNLCEDI